MDNGTILFCWQVENDINHSFASVTKLFNVAYYIVTVIKNYLLVVTNNGNEGVNLDEKYENKPNGSSKVIEEPFLSPHGLEKLNESVVYVVYLLAVLKSFHKNFKHVSVCFFDHICMTFLKY